MGNTRRRRVAGQFSPGMWLCGGQGQAAVGRPTCLVAALASRREVTRMSRDIAVLVNSPPQVVGLTGDLDKHLVQMPLVPGCAGQRRSPLAKLCPNLCGTTGGRSRERRPHLLHVAQAQWEPVVQPHTTADDLHWEPVTLHDDGVASTRSCWPAASRGAPPPST